MVLQRLYPRADFGSMEESIERLWRGYGFRDYTNGASRLWAVPLDVEEEGDNLVVRASLPGVNPDDTQVTIEDGVLTIKAESEAESKQGDYLIRERRAGSFHRSLRLPDTVDTDKAHSSYEHGVLAITFPKQESKKAKRLEIKVKS